MNPTTPVSRARRTFSPTGLLLAGLALFATACGGGGAFGLSSNDNDPEKLAEAFAKMQDPSPGPMNRTGKPLAFLAARGKPKELVAFDLAGKAELWRVPSEVSSKVVVGRDVIAYKQGDSELVARDVESGAVLWQKSLSGTFVGAAADAKNIYYTTKTSKRSWVLRAVDGKTGSELWDAEANGALGAPAARGGLVFSPFMKQWLAILDGQTGAQITRIRGIDEEISFVRTTPSAVYFGSKAGVFLLDERAATGKRDSSTYGSAKLPTDFIRSHYHWDAFDPIQAGYSAYDRNRVLWSAKSEGDKLAFANDIVTVQTYRFFFGFSAESGDLMWAYNHPRVDIVASSQVGETIAIASMLGEIGAIDPATGKRVYSAKVKGQFVGGTFDAAGWAPAEQSESKQSGTAAALASIARDRDARFNDVKKFAVTALSQLKGGEVSGDLLVLIQNEKTPPYLVQTAADVLVSRKDPEGFPHLVKALELRYDYVKGTKPRAVGIAARAMAALDPEALPAKLRGEAVDSLIAHLEAPETAADELVHLVRAIGALGSESDMEALTGFLLVYRADPAFATQIDAVSATVDVLLRRGGKAGREVVSFVAGDRATQPNIAEYAKRALLQRPTEEGADADKPADQAPEGKGKGEAAQGKGEKGSASHVGGKAAAGGAH